MKRKLLALFSSLFFTLGVYAQSPYIYGLSHGQHEYYYTKLVRFNYLNGQSDTLLDIGDMDIEPFASCMDSYHNKFIFYGHIGGTSSDNKFYIIDINKLSIESFTSYGGNKIEYNPINNSVVFEQDSAFWSIDLTSRKLTCFPLHYFASAIVDGKVRTFNPLDSTYIFTEYSYPGHSPHAILVINSITGEVKSIYTTNQIPMDLAVDYGSGKIFGHINEQIVQVDPFNGLFINLYSIPDYYSSLNEQMSVYDQTRKKYIVPFYTNSYKAKLAVIDMITLKADTIYNQPNMWMNLHQIGYYPAGINDQYESRKIVINPNPVSDYFKITLSPFINGEKLKLCLFDMMERKLLETDITSEESSMSALDIPSGLYILMIINENGSIKGKEKIIKVNAN